MPKTNTTKKKAAPARKKAAAKKTAAKKPVVKAAPAKGADEEANLLAIFKRLRGALAAYAPPYAVTLNRPGRYELWSKNEIEFAGKKRSEWFFAGLIFQSNYIGFYYMPIYVEPSLAQKISPGLQKLLKGKSCFHVKALDDDLYREIERALKVGHQAYKQRGWV